MQLLSVFQNLSQVADRFGRERAETIIADHRARLFGSGIADRATLEYLGAVLFEEQIERVATHRQRLEIDLGSRRALSAALRHRQWIVRLLPPAL